MLLLYSRLTNLLFKSNSKLLLHVVLNWIFVQFWLQQYLCLVLWVIEPRGISHSLDYIYQSYWYNPYFSMTTMGAIWFLFLGMEVWGYIGVCEHCLFIGHTQDKNICSTIYYRMWYSLDSIEVILLYPLSQHDQCGDTLVTLFLWGLYRSSV